MNPLRALFPRRWRRNRMARIRATATAVSYDYFMKRLPLSRMDLKLIAVGMDRTMNQGALR